MFAVQRSWLAWKRATNAVDDANVVVAMTPIVVGTYDATHLFRFVPINGSMMIVFKHAGNG